MRKKIVSLVLAVSMLAASVCTAFAATVDVGGSGTNVKQLVSFFADNTPETKERRLEILNYIKMYMGGTDRDMETLVNAVKNKNFAQLSSVSSDLEAIFNEATSDVNYASVLFALELIRAIPASSRREAINGFGVKENDARVSYEIQDTDNLTEIQTALTALYNDNDVYPAKLRNAMEEHVAFDSDVAPYIVLNLFTAWKDTIRFTDSEDGKGFAAYQVDADYAERLMDNMDGYTLDGETIDAAKDVADALAEVLNNSYTDAQIANMKIVLADSGLGIYVAEDSMVGMDRIEVDGTKIDLSMKKNSPTKVKVNKSYVTVEGFAENSDMTVEYAYVDDMNDWDDNMDDVKMTVGSTRKIAVRVTSKDGKNSEIYYVTLSRPESDNSSSSSNNRRPSTTVPTEPTSTIPTPPVSENTFSDTANHWGRDYINAMVKKGLFEGYDDGSFKPDNGVTRQEMAVVLVRLLGLESELGSVTELAYTDAYDIAEWAQKAVALLSSKGIYLGYDDGEFKPERVLTREEIVSLAMRIFGETHVDSTLNYKDSERISDWARKAVGQASSLEIIGGRDDGTFAPGASVTRAEAAKILYNYMNVKGIY